jgi:hypothetical protein
MPKSDVAIPEPWCEGLLECFRSLIRLVRLELGNGCIERVHVAVPLYDGSVASMSDLLLLRAVTMVDRGAKGDITDFKWLLAEDTRKW